MEIVSLIIASIGVIATIIIGCKQIKLSKDQKIIIEGQKLIEINSQKIETNIGQIKTGLQKIETNINQISSHNATLQQGIIGNHKTSVIGTKQTFNN